MALNLTKRPCKLGPSINTRTEKHGEEDKPAADIPITGLLLDRDELQDLLGAGYYSALFNTKGKLIEPRLEKFRDFALRDKFEHAAVTLIFGLDNTEVTLLNVRFASITLSPQTGGMTEVSLKVQAMPTSEQMGTLFTFLNADAHCELKFGKLVVKVKAQPELPMGEEPKVTDDDGDFEAQTRDSVPVRWHERPAA